MLDRQSILVHACLVEILDGLQSEQQDILMVGQIDNLKTLMIILFRSSSAQSQVRIQQKIRSSSSEEYIWESEYWLLHRLVWCVRFLDTGSRSSNSRIFPHVDKDGVEYVDNIFSKKVEIGQKLKIGTVSQVSGKLNTVNIEWFFCSATSANNFGTSRCHWW